jgi:hypothetical protein
MFAQMPNAPAPLVSAGPPDEPSIDASWAPPTAERVAIVVNLPGPDSVRMGLALAGRGYQPVPLYNCCAGPNSVVAVEAIQAALAAGAAEMAGRRADAQAAPAFLLDSERLAGARAPQPGTFDNRWLVFPQDFPSANYLASQGIAAALVVQKEAGQPAEDLRHVLLRWQEAGLPIRHLGVAAGGPPQALTVERPSRFKWIWYRLAAGLGLKRNSAGGFGAVVPHVSSGGGGFG